MCVSVFWLLYFIFATGKRGVKKYVSVNGLFGSRAFCIIINSCAILAAFPTYRYLLVNILLSILAFILIYFFRHKKAEYRKKNVLDIQLIGFIYLDILFWVNLLSVIAYFYKDIQLDGVFEHPIIIRILCIMLCFITDAFSLYPRSPFISFCSNNYANHNYYTKDDEEGNRPL